MRKKESHKSLSLNSVQRVVVKSILFFAFSLSLLNLNAQPNAVARYEIDAKRIGVDPLDKDAIPRSREFIRLDSTYYVGYMYEGLYKADKSSDHIGFKNAVSPLRKAFVLLQKDFGKSLKTIFNSPENYMQSMDRYRDFLIVADGLRQCYDNVEMPDSVMWVLDQVTSYKFKKDLLGANTIKAWTYHRNRFFTSEKFSFLKNSIEENEATAISYCYLALDEIEQNKTTNDLWFGPMQAELDKQSVYHYLAMLHNYNKNYDSSEYYYKIMAQNGTISWNNFASLKHELGEFSVATEYYDRDKYKYAQKILREPYYFLPILDIYAGRTKNAMAMCKEAIDYAGSTPGFGWYNIALCRSYMYDGQLDSAEVALQKASEFKELHIGTTLTQSQYDFTINLLKLQLADRKYSLIKFHDKDWWYSPSAWMKLVKLKCEKILIEYVLINQMLANPERDRTIYDLFCGESTTTYDEAFYLMKNFSPSYFIKKYKTYQQADSRKSLKRYFELFTHRMEWINGDDEKAAKGFQQMIKKVTLDTTNEKLFMARLYEGLAKSMDDGNGKIDQAFYANAMLEEFPQLVPFSGVKIKMNLSTTGTKDETINDVMEELEDCNIEWVNNNIANISYAIISFEKKGDKYEANITVKSSSGKVIVKDEKLIFKNADGTGKEIALRLFGKGGARVYEKPIENI